MSSKFQTSHQVRRAFLEFFAARGHQPVASSSLVPSNDPTLLFTNAGMNQFKDVFTGQEQRAYTRATSSQKCVRAGGKHNDLENVGRTARHHTFFEMLGNFSFGDYFKADAIAFAWELLTKDYALDPSAARSTPSTRPTTRPARCGASRGRAATTASSGWATRTTSGRWATPAPAGPAPRSISTRATTPLRRGGRGPALPGRPAIATAGSRSGTWCSCSSSSCADKTRRPLPKPSIDTGMGLERLCAVLQGMRSNYETDLLRPLIDASAQLAGKASSPTTTTGSPRCRCGPSPTTRAPRPS